MSYGPATRSTSRSTAANTSSSTPSWFRTPSDRQASAKTGKDADEVAPKRVRHGLVAGNAARRRILHVSLYRRVDQILFGRVRSLVALVRRVRRKRQTGEIDAVVLRVVWAGDGRPLDRDQHVVLPHGSLDSGQGPIGSVDRHGRGMDRVPAHHLDWRRGDPRR